MHRRKPAYRSGIERYRDDMGRRRIPHTADLRIEAWAPSREECIAEAVAAMVESFADLSGAATTTPVEVRVGPGTDTDLLAAVLEEVIYRLETADQLPLATELRPVEDGLQVRFMMADAATATPVGAAPKAVSLHDLHFAPGPQGWSCTVTLDV